MLYELITAVALAGRQQTVLVSDMVAYGWTIWAVSAQKISLATAVTMAGVVIIVDIMRTLPLLAIMRPKMVLLICCIY